MKTHQRRFHVIGVICTLIAISLLWSLILFDNENWGIVQWALAILTANVLPPITAQFFRWATEE